MAELVRPVKNNSVYIDKYDTVINTPLKRPKYINYSADIEVGKQFRDNYYGMDKLDEPKTEITKNSIGSQLTRGLASSVVDLGAKSKRGFEHAGAKAIGWAEKKIKQIQADTPEEYAKAQSDFDKFDSFLREETLNMSERWEKNLQDSNLSQNEKDGLAYDFGSGIGSMASAIGLTLATGGTSSAAVLFGTATARGNYEEALEKGFTPGKALLVGGITGTVEGALESIGLKYLDKMAGSNRVIKRLVGGAVTEFIQEFAQEGSEAGIMNAFGVRKDSLEDITAQAFKAGLIGAALGGGVSVTLGGVRSSLEKSGVDENTADKMAPEIMKKVMSNDVMNELKDINNREASPLTARDNNQANRSADIAEAYKLALENSNIENEQSIKEWENIKSKVATQAIETGRPKSEINSALKLYESGVEAFAQSKGLTKEQTAKLGGILNIEGKKKELSQEEKEYFNSKEFLQAQPEFTEEYNQDGKLKIDTANIYNQEGINSVNDLEDSIKSDGAEVRLIDSKYGDKIVIDAIRVPKEKRGAGVGTSAMEKIISFAEANNKTLALDPSTDLGATSKNRLKKFYKKFGFIENKGKNRDFAISEDMYRVPSKDTANIYEQRKKTVKRGSFKRATNTISLLENADASTLVHEMGHYFLTMYEQYNPKALAPVMKFAGYEGKTIEDLSYKQEVDLQEKFARGFEAYLREGKAPTKGLQKVFNDFQRWLTDLYKSSKDLNIKLTDDARTFFDAMLGKGIKTEQELIQEGVKEKLLAEGYSQEEVKQITEEGVAKKTLDVKKLDENEIDSYIDEGREKLTPKQLLKENGMKIKHSDSFLRKTFMPISTRLKNISPKFMHMMRKFEFTTAINKNKDTARVTAFADKFSKLDERDAIKLDLALKNGDVALRDKILSKNGMTEEFNEVQKVFDETSTRAKEVGIEFGEIENWFPRSVQDPEALISYMKGTTQWNRLDSKLREVDPNNEMTPEEQVDFLNNTMSRYDIKEQQRQARTSGDFRRRRTVANVTMDMNKFYKDSVQAMLKYIGTVNQMIEAKKFWGLDTQNFEESLGGMAKDLIINGQLDFMKEKELKDVIRARFNQRGTTGWVNTTKNLGYIVTMGNPISAVTQIGDLAFSMYKNGLFNTAQALGSRKELTKEDIGVEDIAQEFQDVTATSKAVKKVFKVVGLEFMDNVGKNTTINASLTKFRTKAKNGDIKFRENVDMIFGDESAQVIKDLKNGVNSENVKYLLFSELSDIQPITLSEMPENYLTGGNWRILYMLKTYTMKQLDIYYNDIIKEMRTNPKQAMKNLVRLSASLMVMGVAKDVLKNFLLGRTEELEDLVLDNMLQLLALSKFQIYNFKRSGATETVLKTFIPPIAPLVIADDIRKDINKYAKGKLAIEDARIFNRVPVGGKLYYWWFGGASNTKKKNKKSSGL